MNTHHSWFKHLALTLSGVMLLNPLVSVAGQLSVDGAAGLNTKITEAANGVPVIDIATPNGSGLSHNQFTEYNVGSRGLILNNSTEKLQATELGGYIQGNAHLNGRSASLILNEVTGSNRIIFKGDKSGGGHLYPGCPGKTAFPKDWSAEKIIHEVGDIATSPNTQWYAQRGNGGLYTKSGEPATGKVISAFPDDNPIPKYKLVR